MNAVEGRHEHIVTGMADAVLMIWTALIEEVEHSLGEGLPERCQQRRMGRLMALLGSYPLLLPEVCRLEICWI